MTIRFKTSAIFSILVASAGIAHAQLQALSEEGMSETSGEGIAFVFDDFRFVTSPTSYIEMVGGPPVGATTLKRGDVRYYGMSWTPGGSAGHEYDGSPCPATDVRCPLGDGTFSMAAHDNPFLLRVFDYNQIEYDGVSRNRTVLEFMGPTNQPTWRFAMWGESESNRGSNDCNGDGTSGDTQCYLQSQMIIMGKAITTKGGNRGAIMRFTTSSDPADPTYALIYDSRLSGDFRFSVNQTDNTTGMGVVPNFSSNEGMFLKNVEAHVPVGQMHYQTMTFTATDPSNPLQKYKAPIGNVTTEVTQIPNNPAVYNDFYSAPCNNNVACGYQRTGRPARYDETHGYVEWGISGTTYENAGTNKVPTWGTANGNNTGSLASRAANQTDGLYYTGVANFTPYASRPNTTNMDSTPPTVSYNLGAMQSVNLGDARAEGLLIHHMYVKMLGAN